jgi:TorA maturation chaperone TorD
MSAGMRVLERIDEGPDRLVEKAGVYGFFSRLFAAPPSVPLLQDLVDHDLLTAACRFHGVPVDPRRLEEASWVTGAEEIAVEFTGLFSAPGEHYLPPYESFYVDELRIEKAEGMDCGSSFATGPRQGYIGQRSAFEVRALYRLAGLQMNPAFCDLPDHLAAELDFLAHLASRRADYVQQELLVAAAACAVQERSFLDNHPNRWCPVFLGHIIASPVSHFYRQVATALAGFLAGG